MRRAIPPEVRFSAKVTQAPTGCLLWTAGVNNKGYGTFTVSSGQTVMAHRWAYEQARGPIPPGLRLDHLCRTRNCVNPDHLEPVTQRVNLFRADSVPAQNAAKTRCPFGHPYSGDNLYVPPSGGRHCRTCINRRSLARSAKARTEKVS